MKHASAKVRNKVKMKFVTAILRASQIEDQRDRSMRMRRGNDRKEGSDKKE
jgi:hypothetical protein